MEVSNRARKPTHPPGTAPPYLRISEIAPQLQMSSIQNNCSLIVHWFKIRLNSNAKRQQRLVYAGEVCLAMTNETQPYFICIYIYVYIYIYIHIHIYPIPIHTYRLDDAMIKNHSSFSLACCFLTHSRRNFSSFSKYDPGVPIMQTLLDCLTKADNKKFVHEPRHACHLFIIWGNK